MNFGFQKIFESKAAHRRKLAALPIGEKLRLLDAMRGRAVAIGGATDAGGVSGQVTDFVREDPTAYRAAR